ncbi:MAG: hypothetical protein ACFCUT_05585 [Kiloniellaceae bacterium]
MHLRDLPDAFKPLLTLLGFFTVCALATGAIYQLTAHDQIRVLLFALFVLALSLLFPRVLRPLEGRYVDLVYYAAAIAAAYVYFVSQEARQQMIRLEREGADLEAALERQERESDALATSIAAAVSDLATVEAAISEYRSFLASEAVQALYAEETRVAAALLDRSLVAIIQDDLRGAVDACGEDMPMAQNAIAQIQARRVMRQLNDAESPRGVTLDIELAELQSFVDLIARCDRISARMRSLDSLGPSYEKVQAIWDFYTDPDFRASRVRRDLLPTSIDLGDGQRTLPEVLEDVLRLRKSEAGLARQQDRRASLTITIDDQRNQREAAITASGEAHERLATNKDSIATLGGHTLRGWALTASEWLIFTWPFFLISLLGAKIARVDYLSRALARPARPPAPSRRRSGR